MILNSGRLKNFLGEIKHIPLGIFIGLDYFLVLQKMRG